MTKSSKSYEEIAAELETILLSLQSGEITLNEAMEKYEKGTVLISELEKYLKEAKNKIEKIKVNSKG